MIEATVENPDRTILVVDDEALVRLSLADLFQDEGWFVYEAEDAVGALAILEAHQGMRVVLTDVRMPGDMDGLKLINDHTYANGTAVFTTDGGAARRFKLEVEVPMIGVNVPIPVPAGFLSFSGAKESSMGDLAMRGEDGVRFFTQQKMVTERWPEPGKQGPLSLVFPGNH